MFRLTAEFAGEHFTLKLFRDGAELFTTTDPIEAAEWMLNLGIENPLHLIDNARQWGVVEIRKPAAVESFEAALIGRPRQHKQMESPTRLGWYEDRDPMNADYAACIRGMVRLALRAGVIVAFLDGEFFV